MTLGCAFERRFLAAMLSVVCLFLLSASCARLPRPEEVAEQTTESIVAAETLYSSLPETPAAAGEEETEIESEKEGIPLVVPKPRPPRKAYEEPMVRVLILRGASSITIWGEKELTLGFGNNYMRTDLGSRVEFRPRSARISVQKYPVGVGTFTAQEYEKAMRSAKEWKEKGYTVRVIKAGNPLVQANGVITDTTVYWVALGSFKQREDAEAFQNKLFNQGISCWVIDESILNPSGNIEIIDNGRPRAYADSRVIIGCRAPIEISDVPFGNGFWDSGNHEDRSYLSPLEIIVDKDGKLAVINEVGLEEYVKGIVPVEIRLTAQDEALKAQAVAARTEAVAKLGIKHVFDPYDYCASQHCQEFGGLARRTPRTDAAVDATRGQVLICDGSLVDAVYSANCGGHTECNENVWSSRPNASLRSVSDLYSNPEESFYFPLSESQLSRWLRHSPRAYCADPRVGPARNFRWQVKRSAKQMNSVVNRCIRVGSVKDIKVLKRGVSGRALRIKIVGSRRTAVVNKEIEIRRVLGGIKSTMFIVDIRRSSSGKPTSFVFHGGGWGHGVGMCQSGADGMALRGFTYTEILKHYFQGAEIKQLYE